MKGKIALLLFLILAMITASFPVFAAETNSPKVSIGTNIHVQLQDIVFLKKNGTVRVNILVNNDSAKELDFVDYWVKLIHKNGAVTNVKATNNNDTKVLAKSSKAFEYYASVGSLSKLSDLKVNVIKWDFSTSNFEKTVGQFQVATSYDQAIAPSKKKQLMLGNTSVEVGVEYFSSTKIGDSHQISVGYTLENKGNISIELPSLVTELETTQDLYYPLTGDATKTTLLPRTKEVIRYTATIPASVDIKKLKSVISKVLDTKVEIPLASFQLPTPTGETNATQTKYTYKNQQGEYQFSLVSIQRHPWEDQDILSAEINIKNLSKNTVPVPTLTSNYYFDGIQAEADKVKVVMLDKVFGLAAGKDTNVIITTKIPYTYDFQNIRLQLLEKVNDKSVPIVDFSQNVKEFLLPKIELGKKYVIDQTGRRAELTVKEAGTYKAITGSSSLFNISLEYKNLERRAADLQGLVAYIKTTDNVYVPAQVTEYKNKVQPNSSVIISASATIPSRYSLKDLSLVLGQGITGSDLSPIGTASDSYINSSLLMLPAVEDGQKDKFTDLNIYPYQFDFRKIKTYVVNDKSFKVELEYDMESLVEDGTIADVHKLTLEVVDNQTKSSKTFALNDTKEENNLEPGKNKTLNLIFEDPDYFYYRIFNEYTLNIYDDFKENRKLLASKKLKWFVVSE